MMLFSSYRRINEITQIARNYYSQKISGRGRIDQYIKRSINDDDSPYCYNL